MTEKEIMSQLYIAMGSTMLNPKYDDGQGVYALGSLLCSMDPMCFSGTYYSRDIVIDLIKNQGAGPNAMRTAIFKEFANCINYKYREGMNLNDFELDFINNCRTVNDVYKRVSDSFWDRPDRNDYSEKIAQTITDVHMKEIKYSGLRQITFLLQSQEQPSELHAENVKPRYNVLRNLQQCFLVRNGIRGLKNVGTGSIGKNLFAATSIGNKRKNQEDALIILVHPQNPNFRMLAVADGMGGLSSGEFASSLTVERMRQWFTQLDSTEYYEHPEKLTKLWEKKLQEIHKEIGDALDGKGGTTFCGAIVGKNRTVVANVGDSRAYVYNKKMIEPLKQVTKDQSVAQMKLESGIIKEKDDTRFDTDNKVVVDALGPHGCSGKADFTVLNNTDYDRIIICSDGVSDCLSDKLISLICKITKKEDLAAALVEAANVTSSYRRRKPDDRNAFNEGIDAGKDNGTVVEGISPMSDEYELGQ